jgi:hexosaminidase
LAVFVITACADDQGGEPKPLTQVELDAFATALEVRVEIVENAPATCAADAPFGLCHNGRLSLQNSGAAFDTKNFALYFSAAHPLLAIQNSEFELSHIEGDLQRLEPSASFRGFEAGETKVIPFQGAFCVVASPQVLPRYYVAAPGLKPAIIANTNTDDETAFVVPFTRPEQLLCGAPDPMVPSSATSRFEENQTVRDLGAEAVRAEIVPRPLALVEKGGVLDISSGLSLHATGLSQATLAAVTASFAPFVRSEQGIAVTVSVDATLPEFAAAPQSEAYRLTIDEASVRIVGADPAGAFYGIQSLLALLPLDNAAPTLPTLEIPYDAPRYPYRGVHVDVARNFHPASLLHKLLKVMAAYKLNALHLHLADDEGFRLEIPGLPELTELSGQRCHDPHETHCILPQLGSGPFSDTEGSGHFTRDEFIDLLRAASALHIDVIPEFDMPGHSRAAVRAMALRAAHGDASYRLDDPGDTSQYRSVQFYDDNVANPCLESTYVFVEKLMDEVGAMYSEAGVPLRTWHTGADEVPAGAWTHSPRCQQVYAENPSVTGPNEVLPYFLSRVAALAKARGMSIRAYNDGLRRTTSNGETEVLSPERDLSGVTASTNWAANLQWFDDSLAPLTDLDYQVVLSSFDYLYFDHPQAPDPEERGNPWATRFSDTKRVFSYISGNLAANAQLMPICQNGGCPATLSATAPAKPQNVIGIQGDLWSEFIRSDEHFEYMAFPRMLALAERAWHRAEWEPPDGMDAAAPIDLKALASDWERFANVLGHRELPKLDQTGVRYRLEVPGGRLVNGTLEANVSAPGLRIEYKAPNGEWTAYNAAEPPALGSTELRAVTSTGRAGRAAPVP